MKHPIKLSMLAFGIAALTIAGTQSQSQTRNCAPRDHVLKQLGDRFSEQRQSIGIAQNNTIVELFAAPTTGTWSIIVTAPNGTTCLIASGRAFEIIPASSHDPKA